jgi:hypothetical protein
LVEACLQDLEEGQVKQLNDLCGAEPGYPLTIHFLDEYVKPPLR